jgi:hypothetical protein
MYSSKEILLLIFLAANVYYSYSSKEILLLLFLLLPIPQKKSSCLFLAVLNVFAHSSKEVLLLIPSLKMVLYFAASQ